MVVSVWQWMLSMIRWVIFRANLWLCRQLQSHAGPHQLVFLGGGLAAGMGDYVVLGMPLTGAARHVSALLTRTGKTRRRWTVLNLGEPDVCSRDWNPQMGKLLENEARLDTLARADLIVVAMGSEDSRWKLDPRATVEHLDALIRLIGTEARKVVICTIPNCPDASLQTYADLKQRNELIVQYCLNKGVKCLKLHEGLFIGSEMFSKDLRYFSRKGYFEFAKFLVENVENDLVKIEYEAHKQQLGLARNKVSAA